MVIAQRPVLVTPPAESLVDLADAKAHCRVDADDDETLITGLIQAATDHLDGRAGILGRCLVTQTWRVAMSGFPASGIIRLPFPDVQSVIVAYFDADGVEQTFTSGFQIVEDALSSQIDLDDDASWPSTASRPDAVKIDVTAGYGAASDVPQVIRLAAKLMIAHWYENRDAASGGGGGAELPLSARMLLAPFRRGVVG